MAGSKAKTAEVGKKAPNFTLDGSDGKPVSLSDFFGKKVILFFYPKDMTTACTQEACDFRDAHGQFAEQNAVIIGISNDDVGRHNKFIAKYELPYVLLADTDHRVCELYGVWQMKKLYGREYMGLVRSAFLIDEKGKLVQEWRNIRVKGHAEQVLDAVTAAVRSKRKS